MTQIKLNISRQQTCITFHWFCSLSRAEMANRAQKSGGFGHISSRPLGAIIAGCTWSSGVRVIISLTVETRRAIKAVIYRPCSSAVAECARGARSRCPGTLDTIVTSRAQAISWILWYWCGCRGTSFAFTEPSCSTRAFRRSLCIVLRLKRSLT